jgi:multidrug efflux pump subunit AcrA (membrane-fusion protein)
VDNPEPTEKQQRTQKKRALILSTALKVFAREGYGDTDIQVIADLAGVGKGTIYRHFGNKQEFFLATARYSQEMMGAFIRSQVDKDESAERVLRQIATAYARFVELHPESVEIMIQERATFRAQVFPTHLMYRAETRDEFEGFLRQAIERGELHNIDVSDITTGFSDLLYGTVVNGCLEGAKGSLLYRVERALGIFLRGIVIGMSLLVLISSGCGVPSGAAEPTSTATATVDQGSDLKLAVTLAAAEQRSMTTQAEFTGSLLPNRVTPIMSEVEGVAMKFAEIGPLIEGDANGKHYSIRAGIQPGQEVTENQVLVQLDPTVFELQVASAKARLDKAQADLAQLMAWEREESIDRLKARLAEAKARQKLAAAEHQRALTLSNRNAASQGELERAAMELAAAEAMVDSQLASLREAQAGPTPEAIAVSKSLVAQAETEWKQAQRMLEKTAIRAPYDGSLTEIKVYKGQQVSPATGPLFEILDLRYLAAEVGVPEAFIGKIQINDLAEVAIAGATASVPGAVISINDKVDAESRSYRIRVAIDNEQRIFKAGQFVTVRLPVASSEATTIVPAEAIQFIEGQPGVFVYADGVVHRRRVTLGLSDRNQTEILDGLAPGELVVIDDPSLLSDGMRVVVRNQDVLNSIVSAPGDR